MDNLADWSSTFKCFFNQKFRVCQSRRRASERILKRILQRTLITSLSELAPRYSGVSRLRLKNLPVPSHRLQAVVISLSLALLLTQADFGLPPPFPYYSSWSVFVAVRRPEIKTVRPRRPFLTRRRVVANPRGPVPPRAAAVCCRCCLLPLSSVASPVEVGGWETTPSSS